jgi:hypothetical protein
MDRGFIAFRSRRCQEDFLHLVSRQEISAKITQAGSDPLLRFDQLSPSEFNLVRSLAQGCGASIQATFKSEHL